MIHGLKTLPIHYEDVRLRRKHFEIRSDDRNYKVGDYLDLKEWSGTYTGRSCMRKVTHILSDCPEYGLKEGFIIMSIE